MPENASPSPLPTSIVYYGDERKSLPRKVLKGPSPKINVYFPRQFWNLSFYSHCPSLHETMAAFFTSSLMNSLDLYGYRVHHNKQNNNHFIIDPNIHNQQLCPWLHSPRSISVACLTTMLHSHLISSLITRSREHDALSILGIIAVSASGVDCRHLAAASAHS